MKKINIRDVNAAKINNLRRTEEAVGITRNKVLIGVLLPLTEQVLRRLTESDDQLAETLAATDAEMASGEPPQDLPPRRHGSDRPPQHDSVGIRDFGGARLDNAIAEGRPLLVTSGNVAEAVFIPVDRAWMERILLEHVTGFLSPEPSAPKPAHRTWTVLEHDRAIGIRIIGDGRDGRRRIVGTLTDGLAEPIGGEVTRLLPEEALDHNLVFDAIGGIVKDLMGRMAPVERLLGVGVELGGHIHEGRIVSTANLQVGWQEFPFADRLRKHLGLAVVVENDANALALYKNGFGGPGAKDFAVVLLTRMGVGSGLIIDGKLYRGNGGMAGEIGHIPVAGPSAREDSSCRCTNPNCLESAATPNAIELELQARGYEAGYDRALAEPDHPVVAEVLREAGETLGRAIASLINIMNPRVVVLSGPPNLIGAGRELYAFQEGAKAPPRGSAPQIYVDALCSVVVSSSFSNGSGDCRLSIEKRDAVQGARAAAACLIDHVQTSGIEIPAPTASLSPTPVNPVSRA